ncbi:MAG: hypothetical protein IGS49_01155 [Chlorogloeopsis fritschii C42_A2020_084]|uniref:hypothetical protein n=1 Tax=Chlorogloeopsis fritschii TaxID=1124 RepID=UPI0019F03D06|nr:hypothetical protein [Chlorogloeopsis fritschii]MBF2004104.1 hypothetical protein [Chlorogloeopsis fritschii C42_A2020_084]
MHEFPNYITHYYEQGSDILKNICTHPDEVAEVILAHLKDTGKRTWLHPGYLEERRRVEAWLYEEFEEKGKKPYLKHPLYFVLGENDDFFQKNGFFSNANPAKLRLPLSLFTSNMISFTYPDSMPSLAISTLERGEAYRKPFHGKVFTLEEINDIVQAYGLPGDKWKYEEYWRYDRFIEVQIWDDRPIWNFLQS